MENLAIVRNPEREREVGLPRNGGGQCPSLDLSVNRGKCLGTRTGAGGEGTHRRRLLGML